MTNKTDLFYLYGFSYLFFFLLLWFTRTHKANRLVGEDGSFSSSSILLVVLHVAGIILFGAFPFFFHHSKFVLFQQTTAFWHTAVNLFLAILVILVSLLFSVKSETQVPHSKGNASPDAPFLILYFFVRIAFIVSYEMWFRGWLLTDSIANFGVLIALCLNLSLYTLLHIVNSRKEMIGCIPFGLILCCLCIWQGAVWPAILIHLVLTISYELKLLIFLKAKTLQNESLSHRSLRLHRS
jgi:membrane protease YdiL (CAAX protease family)